MVDRVDITDVILLGVSLFVVAAIVPPALVNLATAALTSVNAAVITIFQVALPIVAVAAILLRMLYKSR